MYSQTDDLYTLDAEGDFPFPKRKKQKTIKCSRYLASEAQSLDLDSPQLLTKHTKKKKKLGKGKLFPVRRPLTQVLAEEGLSMTSPYPNFMTMSVKPGLYPRRYFCSICGYEMKYTCLRCGEKYCSKRCGLVHRETHCLKFEIS